MAPAAGQPGGPVQPHEPGAAALGRGARIPHVLLLHGAPGPPAGGLHGGPSPGAAGPRPRLHRLRPARQPAHNAAGLHAASHAAGKPRPTPPRTSCPLQGAASCPFLQLRCQLSGGSLSVACRCCRTFRWFFLLTFSFRLFFFYVSMIKTNT